MPPNAVTQNVVVSPIDPSTSLRKRPPRIPGLAGTSAAFLVPEFVQKKFMEGWSSHVPLTYLTDKGCLFKTKSTANAAQEYVTYDQASGLMVTNPKTLSDQGELELTFDEWHQAWRRLLELIKVYIPQDFLAWEVHFAFILNSENRAELWPLYLAYDAEIRRRTTRYSIDPSVFSIGIWNDLETRYTTKKVLSMVQADLKQNFHYSHPNPPSHPSRNPAQGPSFRNQHPLPDNPKTGRCIFCGDRSKTHLSRNCTASCYTNGSPCHLSKHEPSGARISKTGKHY